MSIKTIAKIASLMVAGAAVRAEAQQCTQTLVFNHSARTISKKGSSEVLDEEIPSIRANGPVCLEVEGTSSGAYDISFDSASKEDLGNVAALKTFWSDFKPLQLDLLRSAIGSSGPKFTPGPGMPPGGVPNPKVKDLQDAVAAIDGVIDQGRDLEYRAMAALGEMARTPADTSRIASSFSDCESGTMPDGSKLASCKKTLEDLKELDKLLNKLVAAIDPVIKDTSLISDEKVVALVTAARERRQGFSKIVASERQLRQLVQRVREAKTVVKSPTTVRPEWDEGRLVVVTITPASFGDLGTVGGKGATFKVKVLPSRGPRLSAGAALLFAPNASYSTYSEVTNEDGSRVVAESGTFDRRLLWGLTLSATWAGLDEREGSGFALYLPELVVGPDDEGLAVGLGVSAGWKVARVSTGFLWVKRPILEGAKAGTVLESGQALKVRDGYDFDSPTWYLGFGLAL
jgi:hypothetical protein